MPRKKAGTRLPVDDISVSDIEKDLSYVKSPVGEGGVLPPERPYGWSDDVEYNAEAAPPPVAHEKFGEELEDNTGPDWLEDTNGLDLHKNGVKEVTQGRTLSPYVVPKVKSPLLADDAPRLKPALSRHGTPRPPRPPQDAEFEELKSVASRLQDSEDETLRDFAGSPAGNRTEELQAMLGQLRQHQTLQETIQTGKQPILEKYGQDLDTRGKPNEFENGYKFGPEKSDTALGGQIKTAYITHRTYTATTVRPSTPGDDGSFRRKGKRKTTVASSQQTMSPAYDLDNEALAQVVGEAESHKSNSSVYSIVEEGRDKIDVPLSGTSTWHTIIHGRADLIVAGAVIAGVGLLIIIMSIIHLFVRRSRARDRDLNQNQRYRRLGTADERAVLKKSKHSSALFDMSSDDETDAEDDDEEDTLYIRGKRSKK
ncbi:uncharacterized protein LOC131939324 [Physella acuta]|uniref:uncharacterized protein LOC131939324 n=1 Tax=Physella acuta TaxID=109671 RepID=UPI0027DD6B54|nr:uncharacterized protein LOC131939324 [Physella acuta]XP_059153535.1 uncharacterized protein LOC131939324 [Physella acuta]